MEVCEKCKVRKVRIKKNKLCGACYSRYYYYKNRKLGHSCKICGTTIYGKGHQYCKDCKPIKRYRYPPKPKPPKNCSACGVIVTKYNRSGVCTKCYIDAKRVMRNCKVCGKDLRGTYGKQYCSECRKNIKYKIIKKPKYCKKCSVLIPNKLTYCTKCRAENIREKNLRYLETIKERNRISKEMTNSLSTEEKEKAAVEVALNILKEMDLHRVEAKEIKRVSSESRWYKKYSDMTLAEVEAKLKSVKRALGFVFEKRNVSERKFRYQRNRIALWRSKCGVLEQVISEKRWKNDNK